MIAAPWQAFAAAVPIDMAPDTVTVVGPPAGITQPVLDGAKLKAAFAGVHPAVAWAVSNAKPDELVPWLVSRARVLILVWNALGLPIDSTTSAVPPGTSRVAVLPLLTVSAATAVVDPATPAPVPAAFQKAYATGAPPSTSITATTRAMPRRDRSHLGQATVVGNGTHVLRASENCLRRLTVRGGMIQIIPTPFLAAVCRTGRPVELVVRSFRSR